MCVGVVVEGGVLLPFGCICSDEVSYIGYMPGASSFRKSQVWMSSVFYFNCLFVRKLCGVGSGSGVVNVWRGNIHDT